MCDVTHTLVSGADAASGFGCGSRRRRYDRAGVAVYYSVLQCVAVSALLSRRSIFLHKLSLFRVRARVRVLLRARALSLTRAISFSRACAVFLARAPLPARARSTGETRA